MTQPLREKLYGNCYVLNPDGEVMFHCNQEKINWYLSRNLAELVVEDPPTIRLKFKPNGPGHLGDKYYLTPKINQCVVCGSTVRLTRHHIIPHCYRRHFSRIHKDHSYHDVVLLCVTCHDAYENAATLLKKKLALDYGIPLIGSGWYRDETIVKVKKSASALLNHWDVIPSERREKLLQTLKNYFKKEEITKEDMEVANNCNETVQTVNYAEHGSTVVAKVGNIEEFVKMWRKHFLTTMQPKFMPDHWEVERSLGKFS